MNIIRDTIELSVNLIAGMAEKRRVITGAVYREFRVLRRNDRKGNETSLGASYGFGSLWYLFCI
ncbi:hypothetical protein HNQ56_002704 [Anaerotaenia torta]